MSVSDVFEPKPVRTVSFDTPLSDVVRLIADGEDDYFPVLDAEGGLVGIFSAHDVRAFTFDESIHRLTIAEDLMSAPPIVLTPADDLHTALEKFNLKKLDELPVVAEDDPRRLLGVLPRRAIGRAYTQRLSEMQRLRAD